jgi:prepilin-type N-terminal cleavage/methylation domain-containing protein
VLSRSGEAGFTLVELLVAVALVGMLLAGITGITFVAGATARSTTVRLDESNDLLRAATYFGDDVQGAQSVTVGSPPLCGTDEEAVVEFTGQDFADTTLVIATTVVTYVVRGDATSEQDEPLELHRLACRAATASPVFPLVPVTDVAVLRRLPVGEPAASCGDSPCGTGFSEVDLVVTRSGGLSFTLTGRRRTS